MSWTSKPAEAPNTGGKFPIPPAGSHRANLVAIIDLGTHERANKKNVMIKQHLVFLVWELCDEIEEGTTNRHLIGERYNFSGNPEAHLRIMLETWRTKKFAVADEMDLAKCLGKPCLVSISHKPGKEGREFANLAGVSVLPKGMLPSPPQRTPVMRQCTSANPLPHWLPRVYGEEVAEIIKRSHECRPSRDNDAPPAHESNGTHAPRQTTIGNTNESDIPF